MSDPRSTLLAVCVVGCLFTLGCDESNSSNGSGYLTKNAPPGAKSHLADVEATTEDISIRVDEVFRAIADGEVRRVYEELTAPGFREGATLEKFQSICDLVTSRLGRLQGKEFSRFDIDPVNSSLVASATYRATFDHGSGLLFVVFEKSGDEWLLLRLNVNAPELLDDPGEFLQPTELHVENSEPVLPGAMVDLLDTTENPPKVILENVRVLNVRWRVAGPSTPPEAPASGFVTFALKTEQTESVKNAGALAIRIHEE